MTEDDCGAVSLSAAKNYVQEENTERNGGNGTAVKATFSTRPVDIEERVAVPDPCEAVIPNRVRDKPSNIYETGEISNVFVSCRKDPCNILKLEPIFNKSTCVTGESENNKAGAVSGVQAKNQTCHMKSLFAKTGNQKDSYLYKEPKNDSMMQLVSNEQEQSEMTRDEKSHSNKIRNTYHGHYTLEEKQLELSIEATNNNFNFRNNMQQHNCDIPTNRHEVQQQFPNKKLTNTYKSHQRRGHSNYHSRHPRRSHKSGITLSQPPRHFTLRERLEWLQKRRDVGVWVQCCRPVCNKWRYLSDVKDPVEVPHEWFCSMNSDPMHNSCAAAEHGPTVLEEDDLIHNLYTAGSVVWAQLVGYPWWPAIVDDDPDVEQYYWLNGFSDIPTHYNVVFFDTKEVTRAWITPGSLRPFRGRGKEFHKEFNKMEYRGVNYEKRLEFAMKQAFEACHLKLPERLQKYGFLARYKGPLGKDENRRKYLGIHHRDLASFSDCSSEDGYTSQQLQRKEKYQRYAKSNGIKKAKRESLTEWHSNKKNCLITTFSKTEKRNLLLQSDREVCSKKIVSEEMDLSQGTLDGVVNNRRDNSGKNEGQDDRLVQKFTNDATEKNEVKESLMDDGVPSKEFSHAKQCDITETNENSPEEVAETKSLNQTFSTQNEENTFSQADIFKVTKFQKGNYRKDKKTAEYNVSHSCDHRQSQIKDARYFSPVFSLGNISRPVQVRQKIQEFQTAASVRDNVNYSCKTPYDTDIICVNTGFEGSLASTSSGQNMMQQDTGIDAKYETAEVLYALGQQSFEEQMTDIQVVPCALINNMDAVGHQMEVDLEDVIDRCGRDIASDHFEAER